MSCVSSVTNGNQATLSDGCSLVLCAGTLFLLLMGDGAILSIICLCFFWSWHSGEDTDSDVLQSCCLCSRKLEVSYGKCLSSVKSNFVC